jgi:hypothetical protein
MEYNSGRNKLIISEYGRNIQKMIEHAITITDKEERNRAARAIVAVMGYLNPHLRDIVDFKHKLWDHLFIMSDFKLDVDSPYPIPSRDTMVVKPQRVSYPNNKIRYKFYGKNMEMMVSRIAGLEEGANRESITRSLANFMKMSYLTWNKDSVDDSTIFDHLRQMSDEVLKLGDSEKLNDTQQLIALSAAAQRKNNNNPPRNNKRSHNKRKR